MRRPLFPDSILFLIALAFLSSCAARQPRPVENTSHFEHMGIGLCEDYPEESRTLALAERDLHLLKTANIRYLRVAFGWDAIEPEPGRFDWSFWDDFVRLALQYRCTLIPYVCYTPGWAASQPGENSWRSPPKDPALFGNFMKVIATRYRNSISSWELWNEPDNQQYWLGSAEQFAELLRHAGPAVRKVHPEAKIVLGGLAWNLSFLEDLANQGALTNVDVVNLHNYYETWSSDPIESIPQYVGRAADILQEKSLNLPIWMAEIGYSSYRSNNWVSAQYRARQEYEHTPAHQAATLFRAMTLLLASGQVKLAAWYRINDLPVAQDVIGDVNNRHLGVLDTHGNPKPALFALSFFNHLFAHGYRNIGETVRVTKTLSSAAEVHAFETPSQRIIVLWQPTYVPGHGTSSVGLGSQSTDAQITIEFPAKGNRRASLYDPTGRLLRTLPVESAGPGRIVLRLTAPSSISVVVLNKNAPSTFTPAP